MSGIADENYGDQIVALARLHVVGGLEFERDGLLAFAGDLQKLFSNVELPLKTNPVFDHDGEMVGQELDAPIRPRDFLRSPAPLTAEMLIGAAQASLAPEQYEHFEAIGANDKNAYARIVRGLTAPLAVSPEVIAWSAVRPDGTLTKPELIRPENPTYRGNFHLDGIATVDLVLASLSAKEAAHFEEQPDGTITPVDPLDMGIAQAQQEAQAELPPLPMPEIDWLEYPGFTADQMRERDVMWQGRIRALLASQPKATFYGDPSKAGRNLDGVPQPYSGAIVLLETIAECGAQSFYEDGKPTPNRELCLKFAAELRDVASQPSAPQVSQEVDERVQFQKSVLLAKNEPVDFSRNSQGNYKNVYLEAAWSGWHARAAFSRVPAEQPKYSSLPYESALQQIVEASGIKETGSLLDDAANALKTLQEKPRKTKLDFPATQPFIEWWNANYQMLRHYEIYVKCSAVWNAALASKAGGQAVPDEWQLVPKKLDGRCPLLMNSVSFGAFTREAAQRRWDAILAAAPKPELSGMAVPDGWTIKRHADGWIFFGRPDGWRHTVTPQDASAIHSFEESLYMLLADLAAAPKPSITYQHHPSITEAAKEVAGETAALKAGFAANGQECAIYTYSSRVCERGTRCCVVKHGAPAGPEGESK